MSFAYSLSDDSADTKRFDFVFCYCMAQHGSNNTMKQERRASEAYLFESVFHSIIISIGNLSPCAHKPMPMPPPRECAFVCPQRRRNRKLILSIVPFAISADSRVDFDPRPPWRHNMEKFVSAYTLYVL